MRANRFKTILFVCISFFTGIINCTAQKTPDELYNKRKSIMDAVFSDPMSIATEIEILKTMPLSRPDSVLFDVYRTVATYYGVTNQNDSAVIYFKKAISYAPPKTPQYVKVSKNLCIVYRRMANYADALVGLNNVLEVAKEINHPYSEGSVYMEIAACYNSLNDMKSALDNLLMAISLFEKAGKVAEFDLATCRLNLGIVYLTNNDLENAEKILLAAMIELKKLDNLVNYEIAKVNYANLLSKKGLYVDAEKLLINAMQGLAPFNEYESISDCRLELGRIYVKQNRIADALKVLQENFDQAIASDAVDPIKQSLNYIYLLNKQKMYEVSYEVGKKVLRYSDLTPRDNAVKFYKNVAIAAFNLGKIKEAEELLNKIDPAVDSLINYESKSIFNQMQMFYSNRIKEQEIELLENETLKLYKQKQITALVIGLLLAVLTGLIIVYYNKIRFDKKTKEILELQLQADEVLQQKLAIENEKEKLNSELKDEILNRQKLAIEAKNTFIRNVSHELRTPLNGIVGTTNILLLDKTLSDDQHEVIKKLQVSTDRLNALVSAILNFESLESGNMSFEKSAFVLKQISSENKERFLELANQKGITYTIACECAEHKTYYSDAIKLKTIISNLVLNAINFTNNGSVTLRIYPVNEGEYKDVVRFEVEDTGIGIEKEKQNSIFKAFEQVDLSNTKKVGGLGLGLSISQAIAKGLNSKILFESEANKGSRFWIDLELEFSLKNVDLNKLAKPSIVSTLKNIKALVVEDSAVNAFVLMRLLENQHVVADLAENGKEAYNKLKAGLVYDIMITDLQMPEMDGITLIKTIRSTTANYFNIPIIAITASTDDLFKIDAIQAGANAFLNKPYTETELISTMMELLNKKV